MAVALLLHDIYIATREDALLVRPLITALGPVWVHKLMNLDPVIGEKSKVSDICRIVGVERGSGSDRGRCICWRWWDKGRSRVVTTRGLLLGERDVG